MIGNLTQHIATPAQKKAGVVEPANKKNVQKLLTFADLPSLQDIIDVADGLVSITNTEGWKKVMIGGAPYLMYTLEIALRRAEVSPLYAFSKRETIETVLPNGSVEKKNTFTHEGFIEAYGTFEKCYYCGRRLCAALYGDTQCSQFPEIVSGMAMAETVAIAKSDWDMSECDTLCAHSRDCSQTVVTGADTYLTPVFKDIDIFDACADNNPTVEHPSFHEKTCIINCAGFLSNEKLISLWE